MIDRAHKSTLILFAIATFYFLVAGLAGGIDLLPASMVMTICLGITMFAIYDRKRSILSMFNLFVVVFLIVGFFLRYIVVLLAPAKLAAFSLSVVESSSTDHFTTAILLLIFIVPFAIVVSIFRKTQRSTIESNRVNRIDGAILDSTPVLILFLGCNVIYVILQIQFGQDAADFSINTHSSLIGFFEMIVRLMGYAFLAAWVKGRKTKHLLLYAVYAGTIVTFAFVQHWKGPILYELLFFFAIVGIKSRRGVAIFGLLGLTALLVVVPVIAVMRQNEASQIAKPITFETIVSYNEDQNVFVYVVDRFGYYDEAYFVASLDVDNISSFRQSSVSLPERLLAGLIPRALWKEKPLINTSDDVTYKLVAIPADIHTHLTVGYLGESYAYGGVIGVIILSALLALCFGLLEYRLCYKGADAPALGVYYLLGSTLLGFTEGDIAAHYLGLVGVIVLLALLRIIVLSFMERGEASKSSDAHLESLDQTIARKQGCNG